MTFPNRDNDNFPDFEQEKRHQAREESRFARGEIDEHPEFTRKGPDHEDHPEPANSNLNRIEGNAADAAEGDVHQP